MRRPTQQQPSSKLPVTKMNRLIQATAFFLKRQQRCPRGTHSRLFLPPYLGTHWSNPHQKSASNSGSRSKGLGNHFYRSAQTGCPNACCLPDVKGLLNLSEPPLPVSRKAHCGKLKGSTRKIEKSMASSPRRSLETDTQEKRTYSELMFAGFLHIAELGGRGDSQSGRRLRWPFHRGPPDPNIYPQDPDTSQAQG